MIFYFVDGVSRDDWDPRHQVDDVQTSKAIRRSLTTAAKTDHGMDNMLAVLDATRLLTLHNLLNNVCLSQAFINQSFENITSIEHSLKLLHKFQSILQRESLKSDLDSKLNIIFQVGTN